MATKVADQQLDKALKQLSYGFYIVATRKGGEDLETRDEDWVSAATVSWAMQSSFHPPLITIAVQKDSDLNETIQKAQSFSLTVLGKSDEKLIKQFAEQTEVDYSNSKVNGISYKEGETGAPILDCGIATLECKLEDALTTPGDHLLFVGRIVSATSKDGQPITEADTRKHYEGTSPRS
ncbi:flavin reductase (DIM6/NTAB) family NADH-FMN oxidoreductase RutF [Neolewinella xylanilytica]|uniref:Flavin reductase (DIM6/NTAB) family NADH-FMN oxidoreductase RutF n=1 Tax=Neolewinella xylanilytica TaxID=1514080 RepID=A0A2S6I1C2_9BACT|nr:flavin reductase family protein [Neolewinella xylanilytica]PPK84673.1 flavin reductase (DIM6/NTAB) family NADH-FMN oxidoreductase RutF [Neolewinella xylanilytica]